MKLNKKRRWEFFIKGFGLRKAILACEKLKRELHSRYFYQNRNEKSLIMAIRLEHFQIKKHQKISMKYLHELEQILLNK